MSKKGSKVNIKDLSTKKVSAVKCGIARRAASS
jgi:hypothetical protein